MLALALFFVNIVLKFFLESFINYTVIRLTAKKSKKLEPAFRLTLLYPKHIIIYLGNSLTGGKYQLHLQHHLSHQK